MFRLRIAAAARADMDSIADFIRRDNPVRAESFIEEVARKIETIAERPMSFPLRTDLEGSFRSALHGSYLVIFGVRDEEVVIARVVHGARDIENLL
ncbi:MAG: type II toxin-antitoxin system RelE/ParE family toxin [Novosphingobium sp.]|nr:type II toxin-antitoxin system RelE/ParE family toxin [Novosphingobium sp.]